MQTRTITIAVMSHQCYVMSSQITTLFNTSPRLTTKKGSKLCMNGSLWWGIHCWPVDSPSQRTSNVENVSMSWRHHTRHVTCRSHACIEAPNFAITVLHYKMVLQGVGHQQTRCRQLKVRHAWFMTIFFVYNWCSIYFCPSISFKTTTLGPIYLRNQYTKG